MAQYFYDFRHRIDVFGATPAELEGLFGTTLTTSNCLISDLNPLAGADTTLVLFDAVHIGFGISSTQDMELLACFNHGSSAQSRRPHVRASGDNLGYLLRGTDELLMRLYRNNTALTSWTDFFGSSDVIPHFWRLGVSGTTVSAKVWQGANPEPSAPQFEVTDSNIASGVPSFWQITGTTVCHYFGVGTDGDPAPTGPVEVSAEGFLLRHNPRTNKVIPVLSSPTVTDIGAACVRPRVTKGF